MRVRLRLTLLYGLLFLLSGAVLLTINYLLVTGTGPGVGVSFESSSSGDRSVGIIMGDDLPDGVPLTEAERRLAEIARREFARQQAEIENQLLVKSGTALAFMSVLSMVLGWFVAGRVLRPLRTMTDSIQVISARNVHERLAVSGPPDELKNLADTVDGLLGRLETALDAHKRFVANAAHELRTPLTVEHALLEEAVIEPNPTVDSNRARFLELLVVSEQHARLLESLLVLSTSERGLERRENVDLADIVDGVLRAVRTRDPVVVARIRPARTSGDPALIQRLVANLVDNAICHNVPAGRVEVTTGACFLSVENTGPQIPPETVDRLLEPFQRLNRAADDGHHGLGLSIVRTIAVAHAARLTMRARPGGGLVVRVDFVPGV